MEQMSLGHQPTEPQVLSVSDLNRAIRGELETLFELIWVQGEISNFKAHTSGHYYFSLKDSKAQVNAVMFKGYNARLKFRPEDGLEVLVRGKITVYEPRGNYQVFCEMMEPVGAGALQKAFEQLKKKLAAEGLFDEKRKRPLPEFPKHLAVVTSPTGAAIKDILKVLKRRFSGLRVTVVPALVQGDQATPSIVKAIELAQRLPDVDVMIVGRGGGSLEDMWAFNTEPVARAIAACKVPVISAVGHEIDYTIADFVADLRAPTPSAAAEMVVGSATELVERIWVGRRRLETIMRHLIALQKQKLNHMTRLLVDPRRKLQDFIQRLDELRMRLDRAMERSVELKKLKLGKNISLLDSLSPLKVVERGYSIVDKGGEIVKSTQQLQVKDEVRIRLAHGEATAEILQLQNGEK